MITMVRRVKLAKKRAPTKGYVRCLPPGARLPVIDNTGAKIIEIITVPGIQGTHGRMPTAMIGDMVVARVVKGTPEMRNEVVRAIVVRTRKEFARPSGMHVRFETNAAVVVNDQGDPRGSEIKSVIAREPVERWPGLGKIARMVV